MRKKSVHVAQRAANKQARAERENELSRKSPEELIAMLDRRLGKGVGAVRERARIVTRAEEAQKKREAAKKIDAKKETDKLSKKDKKSRRDAASGRYDKTRQTSSAKR